jgi:type III restriction enzyme
METALLKEIQKRVVDWREAGRQGIENETRNILSHIQRTAFLHKPQIEALETYIYLKEIAGNKPADELFKECFPDQIDALTALGYSDADAFKFLKEKRSLDELLDSAFGESDYINQVFALTMGSGKTVLMAVMMMYDFVLSFHHPDDVRFAKNALVFAPDTTIIESLKEIKTFDFTKVLPKEYETIMLNVKYHYLEDIKTPLALIEGSNYNIIVSNSQKIILKTRRHDKYDANSLFADEKFKEREEIVNKRLRAIQGLSNLSIFVDEAHHSYGKNMDKELKKVRQTIEHLHGNEPLVGVVNLTGTPYVNNVMMADTVYHFGLKQGIEQGILKRVEFYKYDNVKDEAFVFDVLQSFWEQYGEKRLEGKLPKIALYSASIDDLRDNLKPLIEKGLRNLGVSTDKILEYHTGAEENKDDFRLLDTPQSEKQFVLLVGKGTEGWNCRSLTACALFRKPKSTIFVLQSSTRCLRSIGDNSTIASIYLSNENHKVLDKELRNNFATSIDELSGHKAKSAEFELRVEKRKKLTVKRKVRELLSVRRKDWENMKINLKNAESDKYLSIVSKGKIDSDSKSGEAHYKTDVEMGRVLKQKTDMTFYEILEFVNRYTHVGCLELKQLLETNKVSPEKLTEAVKQNKAVVYYLVDVVLENLYDYEHKEDVIEEEIELTKNYPFKINILEDRKSLIVFRETVEENEGDGRLGFHINPYNFDSGDEKDIFLHLRSTLDDDEDIVDVYFTGGVTTTVHNDFYFEYCDPENDNRLSKYFPDFLVETSKSRYLVIEVKTGQEQHNYERNKKEYKGKKKEVYSTVFAKELGFESFRELNEDFEYRIVFSTSLREWQKELVDAIGTIKKN